MKSKRIIAFAAAVAMTASVMPASVSAYDELPEYVMGELNTPTETEPTVTEVTEVTEPDEEELPLFAATEYTSGDYKYTLSNTGNAQITAYVGADRSVTIPTELDNHPVTSIGHNAFKNKDFITSVSIGSNITYIGNYAFADCNNIGEIVIPSSVKEMGYNAFQYNISMKKAVIGSGLTVIPQHTFHGCSLLSTVTIGANVQTIGSYAFEDSGLTTLVIPNSVKTIGSEAFRSCGKLASVKFGNSVTTLESHAFRNCDSLTSMTIPNTVSSLGSYVFSYCDSLKAIAFGSGLTYTGKYVCYECPSLTTIKFASSVETISDYSFRNCHGLKTVVIPDSIKYINQYAFANSKTLSAVTFGKGLKRIGYRAFEYTPLTEVVIPDNVTTLDTSVFFGCKSLKSVSLGKNLIAVSESCFNECYALTDVVIHSGVLEIALNAFSHDGNIKRIYIPNTINNIRNSAFYVSSSSNRAMNVYFGGSKADFNAIGIGSTGSDNFKNNSKFFFDCPEPVTITSVANTANGPALTWTASSGAAAYRIYRSESLDGTLTHIGSVKTRTYTDTSAVSGKKYYYHVVAYKDADSYSYSAPKQIAVSRAVAPAAPKFTVTAGTGSASVKWSAVTGATSYRVFYRLSGTSTWSYRTTTATSFNLTGLTGGKKYDIVVRAYNGSAWSNFTSANIQTVTPAKGVAQPVITSVTAGVNRAAVRWGAVSGATSYRIYYRVKGTSTWTCKNTTQTVSVLTSLTGGKTYEVVIRATDGNSWSAASAVKTVTPTNA